MKRQKMTMLVLAVTLHNIPEGMAVGVVYAGYLTCDRIWQMFCCCGTANHFCDEDTVLRDADSNPVCTHGISKLFFTGLYTIS